LRRELARFISQRVGFGWTTYDHTAEVMVVHAFGPGAHFFTDFMNNTDVAKLIMKITFDLNYVGCEPILLPDRYSHPSRWYFFGFGDNSLEWNECSLEHDF
jgi:hypothetical protein